MVPSIPDEPETFSPLGDAAPAWGTAGMSDWGSFLEGNWGFKSMDMDPAVAKQLGVSALQEQSKDEGPTDRWNFTKDGQLTLYHGKFKVGGKWAPAGNGIQLQWKTLNDKPIQGELERLKKESETGRQGAIATELFADWMNQSLQTLTMFYLDDDRKKLRFPGGMSSMGMPTDNSPATQAMLAKMGPTLQRLKSNKS